ncbi:MAG: class I SAM-dependent methyltransferase [Acidimicrobiales bacterium]
MKTEYVNSSAEGQAIDGRVARRGVRTEEPTGGWQVAGDAAQIYEQELVQSLTAEWSYKGLGAAHVSAGQRVLDVACGTGILARAALGLGCTVTGVDNNAGMLDVARRLAPRAEFFEAPAESLPFEDDSFEAALMQFGLMFVEDRQRAVAEMRRVVVEGGAVVVTVWTEIDLNPGYRALAQVIDRLAGKHAPMFRSPFSFGEPNALRSTFESVGLRDISVNTVFGVARFDSVEALLRGEIDGSPLARHISSDDPELVGRARSALAPFTRPNGRVEFPNPAVIAQGRR